MGKELTSIQQKAVTVRDYINQPQIVKQLEAALPSFLTPARFLRTIYTAMLRNPALLDCTKESMLSAMIESAQLGLEPVLGKAALIPYGKEMQFQPMYRGLIDLARRTASVKVTAHVVYEKDEFDIEYGDNEKCYHKPYLKGDRGEKVGTYTVWTFDSGAQSFLFLPVVDVLEVRNKYSKAWKKSGKDSVWGKSEDEMFKKTVIKRHSKLQPCSIEVERAVELDNRIETGESQRDLLGQFDYPTGPPTKTEAKGGEPEQHLIEKFDLKVKEKDNVDLDNLKAYLKLSAETQEGLTTDGVKAFAIGKFDSFWGFYESWEGYKKAGKPEHSSFVQQFIKLRKGDGVKTGLGPAILKHKGAIQAALSEDQELIKKKFYTLYGPEVSYPLDPPEEKEPEDKPDPSPKADEETDQQRMLRLADEAELVDFAGEKMVIVKCPIRDDKPTEKWCSRCNDRQGCDSWKDYDAQVG